MKILSPPECQPEGAQLWSLEGLWEDWLRPGLGLLQLPPPKALLGSLGSEATEESIPWASTTSSVSLLRKEPSEGLELWIWWKMGWGHSIDHPPPRQKPTHPSSAKEEVSQRFGHQSTYDSF